MKEFFSPLPEIIANNGAIPDIPAGTGKAIEGAFKLGADAVYLTVRLTADFVPVVVPSEDVAFSDGTIAAVNTINSDKLSEVDAGYYFPDKDGDSFPLRGAGEKYHTLKEMLLSFPENKFALNLEGESIKLVKEVLNILIEQESVERVIISSVSGKFIKEIRKKLPAVATTFSPLGIIGLYFLFRSGLLSMKKKFAADALFIPESIGPSYMGNRVLIREVRSRKIVVYIWNVKTAKEVKRLRQYSVEGFVTDNLPELLEILNDEEARID